MSEGKDPAIKLFGTTIQLPEIPDIAANCGGGGGAGGCVKSEDRSSSSSSSSDTNSKGVEEEHQSNDYNKDADEEKSIDKDEDRANSTTVPSATSMLNDNLKPPASATTNTSKMEESDLKKRDKILGCPRCNSEDTKFCYYNNHNVNQPRHFCKKCQRYWTAGGTMRNVPVGAGRRKNKTSSALQYHQITITEEEPTPQLSSNLDAENSTQNSHGFSPKMPCFPNGLWPYPWYPQTGPALGPPGFQIPLYPAPPYWGCVIPGPWNYPWVAPQYKGPDSSILGKHSRDGEDVATEEKCLWVPKTLRIDDPDEAAKSSIWTTLGIKNDRLDSENGRGILKAFRPKGEETTNPMKETSYILRANPAALSRSLNFQETS